MPNNFSLPFFVYGLIAGIAPEVVRWKKVMHSDRGLRQKVTTRYVWVSVIYALCGGCFAAILAGDALGAVYIGCSWPVLLSGGGGYVRGRVGRKGIYRGRDYDKASIWDQFDLALFL